METNNYLRYFHNNCYKVLEQILRQTKMCDLKAYIDEENIKLNSMNRTGGYQMGNITT